MPGKGRSGDRLDPLANRDTIIIHNYDDKFYPIMYKSRKTGATSHLQYIVANYPKGTWSDDLACYLIDKEKFKQRLFVLMDCAPPSPGLCRVTVINTQQDWESAQNQRILEGFLESVA